MKVFLLLFLQKKKALLSYSVGEASRRGKMRALMATAAMQRPEAAMARVREWYWAMAPQSQLPRVRPPKVAA